MKTVLITGAARGLSRAIAEAFAPDHATAFTWHHHPPDAACAAMPGALAVQADLLSPEAAPQVVARIIERFGRLDILVNNAGPVIPTANDAPDLAAHQALFGMHVSVPAALLAAALPHLAPGAYVVNISSVNAVLPPMGAAIYGASKAAQNLWTRAMAKELGPRGIRVNAVAPGAVNTPEAPRPEALTRAFEEMTALGRLATPRDIAAAVRFLASDAAGAITGHVLDVNGGYRL